MADQYYINFFRLACWCRGYRCCLRIGTPGFDFMQANSDSKLPARQYRCGSFAYAVFALLNIWKMVYANSGAVWCNPVSTNISRRLYFRQLIFCLEFLSSIFQLRIYWRLGVRIFSRCFWHNASDGRCRYVLLHSKSVFFWGYSRTTGCSRH